MLTEIAQASVPAGTKQHLRFIDCARGYAVIMVIMSHFTYEFAELPYALRRLSASGSFGVQFFFMMSSLTLLMSWHQEVARRGRASVKDFFVRRFFRIAPAYYFAALFYAVAAPPSQFDLAQLFRVLVFVNAWHPAWAPTVPGGWAVVPGGWSISVEFTFYALFPLFAVAVTTLSRTAAVLVVCLILGVGANMVATATLRDEFTPNEVVGFLLFWFPGQMPVFALGAILYLVLRLPSLQCWLGRRSAASISVATLLTASLYVALVYAPAGRVLGEWPPLPAYLLACVPMFGAAVLMSTNRGIAVNGIAAAMGRVSFSAYLFHFWVLHLYQAFPEALGRDATGFGAVAAYLAGLPVVLLSTYVIAWMSYRTVEMPMINLGRQLVAR